MSEETPVSLRIVRAVATREGIDPAELQPPLHDVVDTDALEALFADPERAGTVEFTYRGYDVVVESSGDVRVTDADLAPNVTTSPSSPPSQDVVEN